MRIYVYAGLVFLLAGVCSAQDTNFSAGPQYLITSGSPLFARPLATPSLSFETPMPGPAVSEPSANQAPSPEYDQISALLDQQRQMALFSIYYGTPNVNVIEISFRGESDGRTLPASIVESGVTQLTDTQTLRERGYGVTLGEAARSGKNRKSSAPHVYTNSDLERLRGGS